MENRYEITWDENELKQQGYSRFHIFSFLTKNGCEIETTIEYNGVIIKTLLLWENLESKFRNDFKIKLFNIKTL